MKINYIINKKYIHINKHQESFIYIHVWTWIPLEKHELQSTKDTEPPPSLNPPSWDHLKQPPPIKGTHFSHQPPPPTPTHLGEVTCPTFAHLYLTHLCLIHLYLTHLSNLRSPVPDTPVLDTPVPNAPVPNAPVPDTPVRTCLTCTYMSYLYVPVLPVRTCLSCSHLSYLYTPVLTCTHLFSPVHTCSHLWATEPLV